MKPFFLGLALIGAIALAAAQMPKYRVKVKVDKTTDFSTVTTYAWTTGWSSYTAELDRQIRAAIDRELLAHGVTQVQSGPSDVLVTYASIGRMDVDVKSKPLQKGGLRREYPVGTLVVLLLEPGSRRELFRARADQPFDATSETSGAVIDKVVAEMFAKYPTRGKIAGR